MNTVQKARTESLYAFLKQHQPIIFFTLTLALSAGLAVCAVMSGNKNITILTVFTPSLTAIALTALFRGRSGLKELLIKQTAQRVSFRWLVIAILIFPIVGATAIGLHTQFGGPTPALRTTELLPQMVLIMLIAFGEEYGWRGYALPRLQEKMNALVASLILGLVWGFWHFPGYLIGVGVPLEMPFYLFMFWVLGATILITWVYNNTRSVLLAILMHAAANATFNYLSLLPEFTGQITTFSLFLGLLWLVVVGVIAIFGPATLRRQP